MLRPIALVMTALLASESVGGDVAQTTPHVFLKGAEARRPCDQAHGADEIVVCGHNDTDDRLNPSDDRAYATPPLRAETRLGGGVTLKAAVAERALMPAELKASPDQPSVKYYKEPRITLTIPLPRGR